MEKRAARRGRGVATINDVARLAGVSPMTVSRVINSEHKVRETTRVVVNAAIAELNFSLNPAAKTLAGGHLIRLALLYSNPSTNYLSEFLLGSLEEASRSSVMLVVEHCDRSGGPIKAASRLVEQGIDGLILPPPLSDFGALLDFLTGNGIPFVAVANGRPPAEISAIRIDDFLAGKTMTEHLVQLGHRRIGFIRGNPDQMASAARFEGFAEALHEAGIELEKSLVAPGLFTYQSGLTGAEQLLSASRPPTAIFASNDDMAAACIAVAHRRGYDVPRQLTIVGFDDTSLAGAVWPRLTTVRQPIAAMARAAVKILQERIRSQRSGIETAARQVLLKFELIHRDSAAPPAE